MGGKELDAILDQKVEDWEGFTITTFSIGSHTVSTPNWQLISYFDGSFELYDLTNDYHQFKNIADLPSSLGIIDKLKKYIPEEKHWRYFIRYRDYKILVPKSERFKFLIKCWRVGMMMILPRKSQI